MTSHHARTFGGWLRQQADRPDLVGDLARDVIADPCSPLSSARAIRTHLLENHRAQLDDLDALDVATSEFEAGR